MMNNYEYHVFLQLLNVMVITAQTFITEPFKLSLHILCITASYLFHCIQWSLL